MTKISLRNRNFHGLEDDLLDQDRVKTEEDWQEDWYMTSLKAQRPAARKPRNPSPGSKLLTEVAKDSWSLTRGTVWLITGSYWFWKWFVLFYVIWLLLTNMLVRHTEALSNRITSTLCPIPFVGSSIPLCRTATAASSKSGPRAMDASKVVSSQEELSKVMDTVGRGFDLARDMVGHEFAVRDLRIRVAASTLPRRDELAYELQTLVRQTKEAARGLSRFTAKVSKSVDMARTFDHYAIKALEGIAAWEKQHSFLAISGRALAAIRPLSAFDKRSGTEEQVKDVFLLTAARIGDKVNLLIQESFELAHSLDSIHATLENIKEIALVELGDLPGQNVLTTLWTILAHPDDHARLDSHKTLLADMEKFYGKSSLVMEKTTAALHRIDAELGEFRDDFATPGLILKDNSLGVIIDMLRMSAARLEAGNLNLRRVEEGARPQRLGGHGSGEPIAATLIGNIA
ncbi:hypothetical protein QBC42DRAFT_319530 [Cladorrhinum samala]|uniref:Uncharacterized protein n=1 Tax=Cladorrhinum samala TaxID=585594 RepID=A0AAV9HCD9_9PEZI|nr:hypothetical protein QBC42DRAFT_319530 [Cladorrhinum samala]